ncbi:MAG: DUF2782 domain-containing protein [Gammaproteobacteria bacterium]|nr:MAG: DUF2782 domain-containing protein [Gammaproteobacteria bacterium]
MAASLWFSSPFLRAEEAIEVEPPAPPPPVISGEPLEPEVTIEEREGETVEEYRVNGHLYMIKVTPVVGPSYYLMDTDGDGQLESRMTGIRSDPVVPMWVLLSWD